MQNAEQSAETLWSRLKDRPNFKPRDQLYVEYAADGLVNIIIDKDKEPELYDFIEDIKNNGPRFYGYPAEKIEHFAKRIYELRENNANNTTG